MNISSFIDDDKDDDKEDVVVIVENDEDDEDKAATKKAESELEGAEEEDDEERAAHAAERREQRRKERRERKERQRTARQETQHYVEELEGTVVNLHDRLKKIEGTIEQNSDAQLDISIRNCTAMIERTKKEIEDATTEGDGKRLAKAQEDLVQYKSDQIELRKLKQFQENKPAETHDEDAEEKKTQQKQPKASPEQNRVTQHIAKNFQTFVKRNKWYDPSGLSNPTTIAVHEIDKQVAAEGYNPLTPDYWEEIEDRAEEKGLTKAAAKRDAPPGDSPRRSAESPKGGKTTTLSKSRVEALKEAGLWDDPKKRSEMIERYRKQDQENNRRAG